MTMISKIDKKQFHNQFTHGFFCFISTLRNYLFCYGINITDNELAAILSYWGFQLADEINENICGRHHSLSHLLESFFEKFNLSALDIKKDNQDQFLNQIVSLLNDNKRLLSWFDTYHLSYSNNYKTLHQNTILLLVQSTQNRLIFFDNNLYDGPFSLFKENLLMDKNKIYYNDTAIDFKKKYMVEAGLLSMIKNFFSKDLKRGLNGLIKLINVVKSYHLKEEFYNLFFQLNRPGGLTVSRKMLFDFINDSIPKAHGLNKRDLLNTYMNLTVLWKKIANLSFKESFSYSKKVHDRILELLEETIQLEEKGMSSLKSIL